MKVKKNIDLSIIINTFNRKKMLFDLLFSIQKCTFPILYEIIVVDDCSEEDYSQEIANVFPNVQFLRNSKRLFLIKSRNKGWLASFGKIVFFVDDV